MTNLNGPPRALATTTVMWVGSWFHAFWAVVNKSNAGWGLLCHWPSITAWEMYITAQGPPSPK